MKIERIHDTIQINLQTHSPSGSALRRTSSDSEVEVYSGVIGDSVRWTVGGLGFEISMDHDPSGRWSDGAWAKDRAWSRFVAALSCAYGSSAASRPGERRYNTRCKYCSG